jgi:hypothetical protein
MNAEGTGEVVTVPTERRAHDLGLAGRRTTRQPQQYNTNVAEPLPVDEFTEILIGGKQNRLSSMRSREDGSITCLPSCFRNVLDVVTVRSQ